MTLKVVKDWFDEDALCQRRSSRSVNLISQVFKLGLCGTGGLGLVFLGVLLRLPAQRVFSLQLRKLFHYYCSDSTHQRELLQIYLSFEKEGLNTQISILKLGQFYLIFACSSPIFISLFLQNYQLLFYISSTLLPVCWFSAINPISGTILDRKAQLFGLLFLLAHGICFLFSSIVSQPFVVGNFFLPLSRHRLFFANLFAKVLKPKIFSSLVSKVELYAYKQWSPVQKLLLRSSTGHLPKQAKNHRQNWQEKQRNFRLRPP